MQPLFPGKARDRAKASFYSLFLQNIPPLLFVHQVGKPFVCWGKDICPQSLGGDVSDLPSSVVSAKWSQEELDRELPSLFFPPSIPVPKQNLISKLLMAVNVPMPVTEQRRKAVKCSSWHVLPAHIFPPKNGDFPETSLSR